MAGKKEEVLEEGFFAHPAFLGGGWVCVAEGDAQVRGQRRGFVQNKFGFYPKGTANFQFHHF